MELTVEERKIWKTHNLWLCDCELCIGWREGIKALAEQMQSVEIYETT